MVATVIDLDKEENENDAEMVEQLQEDVQGKKKEEEELECGDES